METLSRNFHFFSSALLHAPLRTENRCVRKLIRLKAGNVKEDIWEFISTSDRVLISFCWVKQSGNVMSHTDIKWVIFSYVKYSGANRMSPTKCDIRKVSPNNLSYVTLHWEISLHVTYRVKSFLMLDTETESSLRQIHFYIAYQENVTHLDMQENFV